MDPLMIVLRLTHIGLGVLWAGWALVLPLFIEPATRAAGPAGGAFMQALTGKTPLVKVMTFAPVFVILSGLWMLWIVSNGFDGLWLTSLHGATLTTGSVIGILGFIYGILRVRPLAVRIGQIGAAIAASGTPPSPEQQSEMAQIREAMRLNTRVIGTMMALSVTIMGTARYIY